MRAIPENNLYSPILVHVKCEDRPDTFASGFQLAAGGHIYFVTAKHVLSDANGALLSDATVDLRSYHGEAERGCWRFQLDIGHLQATGKVKAHETLDVAVIKLVSAESPFPELADGVTLLERCKAKMICIDAEKAIKRFDEVLVSNDVYVFGYPRSIGLQDSPQIEYDKPLLRKGTIAGKNTQLKTLILDCPTYPGNSGGPVAEVEEEGRSRQFRVVGVVSQFVPVVEKWTGSLYGVPGIEFTNSGYSIAIPMDPVLDLLTL